MKVTECINNNSKPFFSIEITPPEKGKAIGDIFRSLDELAAYRPQFINVTYHQPRTVYEKTREGLKKYNLSKRPGTVGICAAIQHHYNIEAVPHVICGGFNRYSTEDALIDLHYLGIHNLFAVRGDAPSSSRFIPESGGWQHANQLVKQIKDLNRGIYLEPIEHPHPTDFCVGVAGYPERHVESPHWNSELHHMKLKQEAGADFIITQMCFDAGIISDYRRRLLDADISLPILPGIKPLTTEKQLSLIPERFHVSIPEKTKQRIMSARTGEQQMKAGIATTIELVEKLFEAGLPGVHLFTMGRSRGTKAILKHFNG